VDVRDVPVQHRHRDGCDEGRGVGDTAPCDEHSAATSRSTVELTAEIMTRAAPLPVHRSHEVTAVPLSECRLQPRTGSSAGRGGVPVGAQARSNRRRRVGRGSGNGQGHVEDVSRGQPRSSVGAHVADARGNGGLGHSSNSLRSHDRLPLPQADYVHSGTAGGRTGDGGSLSSGVGSIDAGDLTVTIVDDGTQRVDRARRRQPQAASELSGSAPSGNERGSRHSHGPGVGSVLMSLPQSLPWGLSRDPVADAANGTATRLPPAPSHWEAPRRTSQRGGVHHRAPVAARESPSLATATHRIAQAGAWHGELTSHPPSQRPVPMDPGTRVPQAGTSAAWAHLPLALAHRASSSGSDGSGATVSDLEELRALARRRLSSSRRPLPR
jgi:hypothetical protein